MAQVAVIFDMDGVLVDSAAPHQESWRQLAARRSVSVDDATFKKTFGRTSRDIVKILFGEDLGDEQIAKLDEEKEAIYRDLVRGNVPAMQGTVAALKMLRSAQYGLAVATSGPKENVELVLSEAKLGDYFAAVVTGFDVKRGKPAPDCFLLAAERLGVDAHRCVVVEDAPVGVEAAIAAEMRVIGFAGTHHGGKLRDAGAHAVVKTMAEITPERVAKLINKPASAGR